MGYSLMRKFSPLPLIAFLLCSHAALFFFFRLILFSFVYPQITDHDAIFEGLYIGLKFDMRYAVFLVLFTSICLIIPFFERLVVKSRIFRSIVCFVQTVLFMGMLFVYLVDIYVYFYLNQRVDMTLLDLLKETDIGFTMVWQSYPVVWISLAFFVIFISYFFFWNRIYKRHTPVRMYRKKFVFSERNDEAVSLRSALIVRFCSLVLLFVLGYGQVSSNFFPLRWSNAYFSVDKNIALIALNPMQNLYDTRNAVDFVIPPDEYAFEAFSRMKKLLNIPEQNKAVDFSRYYAGEKPEKPLNVVIIMMESWTTPKTSLPHGTGAKKDLDTYQKLFARYGIDSTPFARNLLENSLYYPNFYANSRTTARGIFSTLTGIADTNFLATSSVRNPKMIDQHIIFNEFAGYERYYMIGGSANWANIRGLFQNNIKDLQLLEEDFWKAPNTDVWGISDLALFNESIDVLSASKKPFIAFIQTAGYHRPFSIPDENEGFVSAPSPDKNVLDAWGFSSEAEFHALRFLDHALQKFFEKAKQTAWYEDTVFILFGDHGTIEYNALMNKSYLAANGQFWQTPFFIHCPKYVPAGINPALHSQADIFPTVAALAGISYLNTTLGSSMLQKISDTVFIPREFEVKEENGQKQYVYNKNLDELYKNYVYIARTEGGTLLLKDTYAYISSISDTAHKNDILYDISQDSDSNLIAEFPELAKEFRQISDDYYYTCKYLMLHNQKSRYQHAE